MLKYLAPHFNHTHSALIVDENNSLAVHQFSINYLFQSVYHSIAILFLMPIIVGIVFRDHPESTSLVTWVVAQLFITSLRLGLVKQYFRLPVEHQLYDQYVNHFTYLSLISGIAWAISPWIFLSDNVVITGYITLLVCIVGLAAGSIVVTSYWMPAFCAYAFPSILSTSAFLLTRDELELQTLGLLFFVFLLATSRSAMQNCRMSREASRLRFKNNQLVDSLKEEKALAEKANENKSRFLASASHDLRQPLHALQLYFSSLNVDETVKSQPKIMNGIQNSMTSLNALFNTLLDISRLDAGLLKPDMQDFYLQDLFKTIKSDFEYQAIQKGLLFFHDIEPLIIRSDIVAFETILRNLLSNAIRYTHMGSVTCTAKRVRHNGEPYVKVIVKDTGVGISKDDQKSIFEEYFQVGNSERDKAQGLGLGLAIVARLAILLKVKLSVQSSVGLGSTFTLMVPVGYKPIEMPQSEETQQKRLEFLGMKMLLIDDDVNVQESMTALLKKWGCEVVSVESQLQAMQKVQDEGWLPDVIMADYRLRGSKTGAEAIKALIEVIGLGVPALLITGDTAPKRLIEAKRAGYYLLHKPVSIPKLKVYLRKCYKNL